MTKEELKEKCAAELKKGFEKYTETSSSYLYRYPDLYLFNHGVRNWAGYVCPDCRTIITAPESEFSATSCRYGSSYYGTSYELTCPFCGRKDTVNGMSRFKARYQSVCAMMLTDGDNFVYGKCDLSTYPMCEVSDAKPLSKITPADIHAFKKYVNGRDRVCDITDWTQMRESLIKTFAGCGKIKNTPDDSVLPAIINADWCLAFIFPVTDSAIKRIVNDCENKDAVEALFTLLSHVATEDSIKLIKSLILPASKLTRDRVKNGEVFKLPLAVMKRLLSEEKKSMLLKTLNAWTEIRKNSMYLDDAQFAAEFEDFASDEACHLFNGNFLTALNSSFPLLVGDFTMSQIGDICLVRELFGNQPYENTLFNLRTGMPVMNFQLYGPSLYEWYQIYADNFDIKTYMADPNSVFEHNQDCIAEAVVVNEEVFDYNTNDDELTHRDGMYSVVKDPVAVLEAAIKFGFSFRVMAIYYSARKCYLYYDPVDDRYAIARDSGRVVLTLPEHPEKGTRVLTQPRVSKENEVTEASEQ